ncbi:MAG: tetratricopeptide (TPR) repeat protein, partial [Hyphomicrobiaceae bacterium]
MLVVICLQVQGAESCGEPVGQFVSIESTVQVKPSNSAGWNPAELDLHLCEGDTIRVGDRSRAAVRLVNDAVLRLDENTTMRLLSIAGAEQEQSFLEVLSGAIQSFIRKPRLMSVSTPYLNGSIEGTEFLVKVTDDKSSILVFEGQVLAQNDAGDVQIQPGEMAVAAKGEAPQKQIVVRPRDQVQWALYYPHVLSIASVEHSTPELTKAISCAASSDTRCAFDALSEIPPVDRDARYFVLRASLLLAVGRVGEARVDIDGALRREPGESAAYALRSVIGVAQNDNEAALADARRAVDLDPASSPASIALSYALQADFKIEAARDTVESAVEQNPDDALALARLAELELMLGNRPRALQLAQQAGGISPGLSRTELVLGFSALASFDNDQARSAFERAIARDSADPLAHLGLGLAKISDGKLHDGRRELEAAVALDSSSSVLRAYLGKAYFGERRYPLDSQQYGIAKQLDPNDPTAFLYDGILKQTVNRPVEALADLESTVALNDNRAVYRSRLLLDEDRAARGTSLARAYTDLGFRQLGINESTQSLAIDPSNASAHRFLADTYVGARRSEISRVSETLQAQMLQDVNINPVQPSLTATNLNIVTLGGAAQPGFSEFTPLFQR